MINYHKILADKVQRPDAHFKHFLSLGSHQSPYQIKPIISFSKIYLYQHTRFPSLQKFNQDNKSIIQSIVIPLDTTFRINSKNTNQLVIAPQTIQRIQIENTQSPKLQSLLYIRILKSQQSNSKSQQQLKNIQKSQQKIYNSKNVTIERIKVQKGKQFQIKGNSLAYIHKGKVEINHTSEIITQEQLIYVSQIQKEGIKIKVQQDSILFAINIIN